MRRDSSSEYINTLRGLEFFNLLVAIVLQNHEILEPFEAKNLPGPLRFVNEGAKSHGLFDWYAASHFFAQQQLPF